MIAVYGANGFIGRRLISQLVELGLPVRAISKTFDPIIRSMFEARVEFQEANFFDPLSMTYSLQDVTLVVQLISSSSPSSQNLHCERDIEENVLPHVRFMEQCARRNIEKYIFISSGGTVYGPQEGDKISETSPTTPISSHGLTKLMVEKYLTMFGTVDNLNYVILRLANPYGPGQLFKKGQGLIPAIMQRLSQNLPIRIVGDGSSIRDFIFIDDVADAIIKAMNRPSANKQILNIGSGVGYTISSVIEAMESVLGFTFEKEFVPARPTDVTSNVLDISRARGLLDWQPRHSFLDGLRNTISRTKA